MIRRFEVKAIVQEPEVARQFTLAGIEAAGSGPEVFQQVLRNEAERMAKVVRAARLPIN